MRLFYILMGGCLWIFLFIGACPSSFLSRKMQSNDEEMEGFPEKESPFASDTSIGKYRNWDNDAKWIAYEKLPDSMKVYPGVHGNGNELENKARKRAIIPKFRKTFNVNKEIKKAIVAVTGLGQYVLYLNGQRVDSSFLNPAWSDYRKRIYYNTYDVTSVLKKGENVLGAIVGTGFFYINRERYRKFVIAQGYPMLRLKLAIHYVDGTSEKLVTDKTWRTLPSAITFSSIYGGEDFDANLVQDGWEKKGYEDRIWDSVVRVSSPGGIMERQEDYPLKVLETFNPLKIDSSKKFNRMIDFGQNISGIIRLKAEAPKGYSIKITPSELINEDHTPQQDASGKPYYWQYTFSGKGVESWQPLFTYYGFRYAGLQVFDQDGNLTDFSKIQIHSIQSLHTRNSAPEVGSFSCSDTLFNKIFHLIRWGIRNNLSHVSTDCPHREKLGWLEQTHLMGNAVQYNYDIHSFYKKIIQDMKDAQLSNGLVPDIAPEYVIFEDGFRDSPEWGSASVLLPWYVYHWYGDEKILAESYEMMKKYIAYLGSKSRDKSYLLSYGLGDWYDLGPEHPGRSQLTPLGLTATAFYYYDAKIVSKIAAVLGKKKDQQKYALLSENIRKAFNKKYYNSKTKVYATGSQTAYAIPLYFGIAPTRDRNQILQNMVDSIVAHNYGLTAGDIGFRYVLQSLEEGGFNEVIYKMNNRNDVPGYGYQIKHGATALTESWQALRNVSNDHMMLGHLMEWFYTGLAGIRQQEGSQGYKKILIVPQFVDGINWVDCTYRSIQGKISVHWKRFGKNKIKVKVEIPSRTTAKVVLPEKTENIKSGKSEFVFTVPKIQRG